jgi:hypothetical protein
VNRKRLIQHLRTLETLTSELRSDVENLGGPDPFCNFILRARRDFRRCSDNDQSKHSTRIERFVQGSHKEAMRYGFRGNFESWFAVLNATTPDPHSGSFTTGW